MNENKKRGNFTDLAKVYASLNSKSGQHASAAGNILCQGDIEMQNLLTRRANCSTETNAGYAAEIHHKVTLEADAALKGKDGFNVDIGPRGGHGSGGSADLTVFHRGKKVAEAGSKYRSKATETAFDQSNSSDFGRQKLCPADQLDAVKSLSKKRAERGTLKSADYADTHKNATDRLRYGEVESKPLKRSEAIDIAKNGSNYTKDAFIMETKIHTINAAKTGAVLSASFSAVSNAMDVVNGKKDIADAGIDIAKDVAVGSVKSATNAAATTAVKYGLAKAGLNSLSKSSAPIIIVSTVFDAGADVCGEIADCWNGHKDVGDAVVNSIKHTGKAAVKTGGALAGAQTGAAVGTIFGPVGTVIGGFIGGTVAYIGTSSLFSIFD